MLVVAAAAAVADLKVDRHNRQYPDPVSYKSIDRHDDTDYDLT